MDARTCDVSHQRMTLLVFELTMDAANMLAKMARLEESISRPDTCKVNWSC